MKAMTSLLLCISLCLIALDLQSQNETVIELTVDKSLSIEGSISNGVEIPLAWASSSQVACFPATRFNEFKGNHVFYRVHLPPNSQLKISITPTDNKRINLYAVRMGVDDTNIPPDIHSVGSCEASYPIYAGKPNYNKKAKAQSVEFMSIRNPYSILIGVAGAENVLSGSFDLDIEMISM